MYGIELLHAIDKWLDQGETLLNASIEAECEVTTERLNEAIRSINDNWLAIRKEVLRNV